MKEAARLRLYYLLYLGGFLAFVALLAVAERWGMPPRWIGYAFLLFTFLMYAAIGVFTRTSDVVEYYVAGRRVPAVFNGMATAADWMSAASFIGLAGTLFLSGYQGLAFIMGWTGGYVLVALLLAPYLRRFGQYTIPDFLGARYGGNVARVGGAVAAILASFVYVVAQIYGVGLITSRFVGLQFEIGVFVGLAGILACSFLGGMRAVTWTQVSQYLILIVAYVTPVAILSFQLTGNPLPQVAYGGVLQDVLRLEKVVLELPAEEEARGFYRQRADHYRELIVDLPQSLASEKLRLQTEIKRLKSENASMREIVAFERQRRELPTSAESARTQWVAAHQTAAAKGEPPASHAEAFPGRDAGERNAGRLNFLGLVFCLMVGTAALPHVLMRYYTTPSVGQARRSVFWSILFIMLLYLTAPAYGVFAKYEVLATLVNTSIAQLPPWVASWGKLGLVTVEDINRDGILQFAELTLNPDVIILAMPEIAGLPYVVSGLVAAGGLAAALSTADGLLLAITSSLSHDVYYRIIRPAASTQWRLVMSKALLMVVAVIAATVAAQRPSTILNMVAWAFSIAASSFFPAMVLGIFWKRANRAGAVAGMTTGLVVTLYYLLRVEFDSVPILGLYGLGMEPWWGIQSTASGVWGVPAGFAVIVVVSLLTRAPPAESVEFVDSVRYPRGAEKIPRKTSSL